MALPNFFIIGAAKAGTTSLHYYLEQHPEVSMAANKEPNFFSGPANGIPYPLGRVETLDAYEGLFDASRPVRGEASVSYANYPRRKGVPERIREAVPEARFIYVVRDPVARAVSHYQHRVAWMGERRPPGEVFGDLSDPYDVCLCPGFYARQLERYLAPAPAAPGSCDDLLSHRRHGNTRLPPGRPRHIRAGLPDRHVGTDGHGGHDPDGADEYT